MEIYVNISLISIFYFFPGFQSGDNLPSPEITPLAKTFFGEYILLICLYFLIIANRWDF